MWGAAAGGEGKGGPELAAPGWARSIRSGDGRKLSAETPEVDELFEGGKERGTCLSRQNHLRPAP